MNPAWRGGINDWLNGDIPSAAGGFDSFDSSEGSRSSEWSEPKSDGNSGESSSGGTWANPDFSILDDRRGTLPEFPIDVFSPKCQAWLKPAAAGAGATVDHVAVPRSIASPCVAPE
jgi:hypothetical protein